MPRMKKDSNEENACNTEVETKQESAPVPAEGFTVYVVEKGFEPEPLSNGGFKVKVREITNADNELYRSGIKIGGGQQIIIKTGIIVKNMPSDVYIRAIGDPRLLVRNECIVWDQPFLSEKELCLAMYCHGQYVHIKKGDIIATIFFEKRNLFKVGAITTI